MLVFIAADVINWRRSPFVKQANMFPSVWLATVVHCGFYTKICWFFKSKHNPNDLSYKAGKLLKMHFGDHSSFFSMLP